MAIAVPASDFRFQEINFKLLGDFAEFPMKLFETIGRKVIVEKYFISMPFNVLYISRKTPHKVIAKSTLSCTQIRHITIEIVLSDGFVEVI